MTLKNKRDGNLAPFIWWSLKTTKLYGLCWELATRKDLTPSCHAKGARNSCKFLPLRVREIGGYFAIHQQVGSRLKTNIYNVNYCTINICIQELLNKF